MCRSNCPFAAALFGSIGGSAAGTVAGTMTGWALFLVFSRAGYGDPWGLAFLVFGVTGMAVGAASGAVGGMVEGWTIARSSESAEALATSWGAGLAGVWAIQPVLWLVATTDASTALPAGLAVASVLVGLGAMAGLVGAVAGRRVIRGMGVVDQGGLSAAPLRSHNH